MDKATAAYFRMNAAKQMKGKKNMSELGNVTDRLLITNVDDKNVGDRLKMIFLSTIFTND